MTHHKTGDKWCIYPMYDFAHPIEDAIEGVTHSICTLEFEDHRPLYDWVVRELEYPNPPRQIEFAKLYVTNVVTGKRYIKKLVEDGIVDGWDDPRLVSIAALRRRGLDVYKRQVTHQVLLLSTPRDYYVPLSISNGVKDKLTHAGNYGINVSMDTLEMLYDIKLDYFIRLNFTGFVDIIDALGGIDVVSDYSFSTHGDVYKRQSLSCIFRQQIYATDELIYS